MSQIRLTVSTKYVRHSPEGMGAAYITENGLNVNEQVGFALGGVYAPIQLALEGGTPEEVERLCVQVEIAVRGCWSKARMIASQNGTPQEKTELQESQKVPESREPNEAPEEKKLIYLD